MTSDEPEDDIDPLADEVLGEDPPEKVARAPRKVAKAEVVEERLHPILSNTEVRAAQAKARSKIDAERKAAAAADIEERETERLRLEEGLTTGISERDEIVNVTIDLPLYSDKILVNGPRGVVYWHGHTYPVPRHVADSLNENMSRAWRHDDQTEGKSLTQSYQRKRNTAINARSGATTNAPARFDA